MWLKVFGLVCAGVFVGAAYREMTEHRRRPCKDCTDPESCADAGPECAEEGDDDAPRKR